MRRASATDVLLFGDRGRAMLRFGDCKIPKDQIREEAGLNQPVKKYVGIGFGPKE